MVVAVRLLQGREPLGTPQLERCSAGLQTFNRLLLFTIFGHSYVEKKRTELESSSRESIQKFKSSTIDQFSRVHFSKQPHTINHPLQCVSKKTVCSHLHRLLFGHQRHCMIRELQSHSYKSTITMVFGTCSTGFGHNIGKLSNLDFVRSYLCVVIPRFFWFKGNQRSQWNNLWQMLPPSNLHLVVLGRGWGGGGVIFSLELFVLQSFLKMQPGRVCERLLAHCALGRSSEHVLLSRGCFTFSERFRKKITRQDCSRLNSFLNESAQTGNPAKKKTPKYYISSAVHLQPLQSGDRVLARPTLSLFPQLLPCQ